MIHAFSGCDTTSGIHYKGKVKVLKVFKNSLTFRTQCKIISNVKSSQKEVGDAAIKAFKLLYGVSEEVSLSKIR